MMTMSKPFDFSHLTSAERICLAQKLLESVRPRSQDHCFREVERREIERRWSAFESGRMTAAPWEDVRQRAFSR
jgi:putative addiction module component (TIGR02574 family)